MRLGAMGSRGGFGSSGVLGTVNIYTHDFAYGVNSSVWSFSRSSPAREYGQGGNFRIYDINEPATFRSPVTGQIAGIALKGAVANLAVNSEQMGYSTHWSVARGTISYSVIASPIGEPRADAPTVATTAYDEFDHPAGAKFAEDTNNGKHGPFLTLANDEATGYCFSCYLKAAERTSVRLTVDTVTFVGGGIEAFALFNLSAGTIVGTSSNATSSIEYAGDGWYRCSLFFAAAAPSASTRYLVLAWNGTTTDYAGTTGSGFYYWGLDIYKGTTVKPYIGPTTGYSNVKGTFPSIDTRAADQMVMSSSVFPSNIGTRDFYVAIDVNVPHAAPAGTDRVIFQADDGTDNNRIALVVAAGGLSVKAAVTVGGSTSYSSSAGNLTANTMTRVAIHRTGTDVEVYINGGAATVFTPASLPTQSAARLGNNVALTAPLDGNVLSVTCSPIKRTDARAKSTYVSRAITRDGAAVDFSIVLLPDIQHVVENSPSGDWPTLYNWIISQKAALNIKAAISVGDLTNDQTLTEFNNAKAGFDAMEAAGIPAMPYIGNHDYTSNMNGAHRDAPNYEAVFTPAYFATKGWFGGCYGSTTENWYGTFTVAGGRQIFVLALETFPRAAVVTWADGILAANQDKETIFVTHSFTFLDGNRVTSACDNAAEYYDLASDYNGDELWAPLVAKYPQIFLTLSGHHVGPPYLGHRCDVRNDGSVVHQIFTNHQEDTNNGARATILKFKPSTGKVLVSCYNPVAAGYELLDTRELAYR